MNELPLVSVVCLCYNHEKFLEEAILSVVNQEYPNKEIIVIDDFSTDRSVMVIEKLLLQYPEIIFIRNHSNLGNCTAFNSGFERSTGAFIIDFATDDVMMPGKLTRQVEKFLSLPEQYGVVYSEAEVISEDGHFLGYHHKGTSRQDFHPEGDIFRFVVQKYFICPPSMMFRRKVLEASGGYDSSLAYEDFNFWIVSARDFYYAFIEEPLVKRRVVKKSFSLAFYTRNNTRLFNTTLVVLYKAYALCRTPDEFSMLILRTRFEMRHAVLMEEFSLAEGYRNLLVKLNAYDGMSRLFYFLARKKIRLFWMYEVLLKYKGVYEVR